MDKKWIAEVQKLLYAAQPEVRAQARGIMKGFGHGKYEVPNGTHAIDPTLDGIPIGVRSGNLNRVAQQVQKHSGYQDVNRAGNGGMYALDGKTGPKESKHLAKDIAEGALRHVVRVDAEIAARDLDRFLSGGGVNLPGVEIVLFHGVQIKEPVKLSATVQLVPEAYVWERFGDPHHFVNKLVECARGWLGGKGKFVALVREFTWQAGVIGGIPLGSDYFQMDNTFWWLMLLGLMHSIPMSVVGRWTQHRENWISDITGFNTGAITYFSHLNLPVVLPVRFKNLTEKEVRGWRSVCAQWEELRGEERRVLETVMQFLANHVYVAANMSAVEPVNIVTALEILYGLAETCRNKKNTVYNRASALLAAYDYCKEQEIEESIQGLYELRNRAVHEGVFEETDDAKRLLQRGRILGVETLLCYVGNVISYYPRQKLGKGIYCCNKCGERVVLDNRRKNLPQSCANCGKDKQLSYRRNWLAEGFV